MVLVKYAVYLEYAVYYLVEYALYNLYAVPSDLVG